MIDRILIPPSTTRNLEIYDVCRVMFNASVINLTYLWRYMIFHHIIPVGPRGYQNGRQFYDDSSIYCHKLKWEIVIDPLHIYDESSIIKFWNEKSSWINFISHDIQNGLPRQLGWCGICCHIKCHVNQSQLGSSSVTAMGRHRFGRSMMIFNKCHDVQSIWCEIHEKV
jgi:hypothetical protein